jgi:hypothetical protein
VAESKRLTQQRAHRLLVCRAGHTLDHPAGNVERDIVVLKLRAGRDEQRQSGQVGGVVSQRITAATDVLLVVTEPARAVVEAVAQRHPLGGGPVHQPKVGQIPAHRGVQVEQPRLDKPNDGGAGDVRGGHP